MIEVLLLMKVLLIIEVVRFMKVLLIIEVVLLMKVLKKCFLYGWKDGILLIVLNMGIYKQIFSCIPTPNSLYNVSMEKTKITILYLL